ncbi:hypothetical protein ACHAWC_011612 [Mediolabrus comicus]
MSNNNGAAAAAWSFPVRLLSSVAVVGFDNEPIYLRGSLSDSSILLSPSAPASPLSASGNNEKANNDDAKDDERTDWSGSDDNNNNDDDGDNNNDNKPGGLFGRIKGAVIRKNDGEGDDVKEQPQGNQNDGSSDDTDEDGDDDDPFGFFGRSASSSQVGNNIDTTSKGMVPSSTMSLTQQLVLHASLDRFEEKLASRPNNGGPARWRSPGSMGTNAMWMGELCQVEERLTVYGYCTNTGIKFILLLETVQMNEDGSKCQEGSSSSSSYASSVASLPSREADLKAMFAQLHDLYVRYNMNPFAKLRGPIKSHAFDKGIAEIARSFNSDAIEQAIQTGEAEGLAWM